VDVRGGVEADEVSALADILHTFLEGLEKQRWIFTAQLRIIDQ
jgi:hypothetical protein